MKSAGAALLLLVLAAPAAAQEMYKCVDAHGVTHYADKPTAGCRNARVDIRASPPISGRLAPPQNEAEQEAGFRRRQIEREQAERTEHAQRAELESRCAALGQQRAELSSGRRLAHIDAHGEPVFMDDAERARRLAEVQAALRECP